VGAKVNNALVPLKTEIKSGDIVEILTSPKGHPSESWLKIVKSANARYKIRNWLRREQEAERRPEAQAEHKKPEKTAEVSIPETELFKIKGISRQKKTALSIDGTSNVLTKLSQCCQPIPGDDVVGFITRGRGITVHKKNCPSLKRLKIEKERFIEIVWEGSENTYPVKLQIEAIDRTNLLKDVADELAVSKANIIKVEATVHAGDNAVIKLVLEVKSLAHLKDIIARLKRLKNITSIQKLNEKVLLK
jgi:GTP pyrophosphokinase